MDAILEALEQTSQPEKSNAGRGLNTRVGQGKKKGHIIADKIACMNTALRFDSIHCGARRQGGENPECISLVWRER